MKGIVSILLVLIFSFTIQAGYSQNMVPNPSFEEVDSCNYPLGSLPSLWSPTDNFSSPDYYNSCSTNPQLQVPNILSCNTLEPKDGEGYAGILTWGPFGREYLQTTLMETLKAGQNYYLELSVSPIEGCGDEDIFTDKIGMGFTEGAINKVVESPENTLVVSNIVLENKGIIINNTGEWTTLTGCYVADGSERALQIGNFYSETQTLVDPVDGIDQKGSYFFVDHVKVIPFDPLPDTILFCDDEVLIQANFLDSTFLWNTNETASQITVNQGGEYSLLVNINGCLFRDKTYVLDARETILSSYKICEGNSKKLSPGIEGTYLWENGETSSYIEVEKTGVYSVTVDAECGLVTFQYDINAINCDCSLYIPNSFTPNDDGLNDLYSLFFNCENGFEIIDFSIFDKWGSRVYQSTDPYEKWDGRINGRSPNSGTYSFYLEYLQFDESGEEKKVRTGYINILK